MAHYFSDDIDLKLKRVREMHHSTRPLRSDREALRLLLSTQDAFHALAMIRDNEAQLAEKLDS